MIFTAVISIIGAYMLCWFLLAQLVKNNGIVDIAWGLGFVLIAWGILLQFGMNHWRQFLITGMATIWGMRLAIYLFGRNWGKPEDWRYAKWRRDWGKTFLVRSFFQVFVLQGLLMGIISIPIVVVNSSTELFDHFRVVDGLGIALFLIGFFFESVGDYQLAQFKKRPENKGKVMDKGLWRYTRHPNYFGEMLIWWGIFCLAIPFWWTIISPIVITFLLLKVSGVAMLERKYKNNDKYADYKRRTSTFFPLPPKEN